MIILLFLFRNKLKSFTFFILGCDGIYDQLTSKEILECAWMVINNNVNLYKKNLEGKNEKNIFKGNYGNEINMSNTSGNIVDMILKASMLRKSFDNVTCLFISFKDFFESIKNKIDNQLHISKELILRNKSNVENIENKIEKELLFSERSNKQKSIKCTLLCFVRGFCRTGIQEVHRPVRADCGVVLNSFDNLLAYSRNRVFLLL